MNAQVSYYLRTLVLGVTAALATCLLALALVVPPAAAQEQTDDDVVAWGNNDYGQTNVPDGLGSVKATSGGLFHSMALEEDGTVVAWGSNQYGQTDVPTDLEGVTAIDAGEYHNLAIGDRDIVAPLVSSVVPQGNATDIGPGTNVRAFFSEAMREGSIDANSVKIFKAGQE